MSLGSAERSPTSASGETKGYTVTAVPATSFGKYVLIGKLGHGGMAEVNLAVMGGKGNFRKLVVIKRMHAHLEAEPGFIDMFLDEARLAAQLDHPHCVQTLEVGEANGQHFLAMEYLDGQGLERLLRITGQRGETLPPSIVARMIADALDGLGYAHELTDYEGRPLGVVHRDVSPQNLFVTYNGVVKLLDFGIAKATSNVVETRTGVVKGKYAYIAPEQALATPVDSRADVWSMGVVMWEMLTSRRLFKSHNELATLQETLTGKIPPPSSIVAGIPPELDRIVLHALTRDVSARYQTASAFKDDLEAYLGSAPERAERRDIAKLMQDRFGEALKVHRAKIAECLRSVTLNEGQAQRLLEGAAVSASAEMPGLVPGTGEPYLTPSGISMSGRVGPGHVVQQAPQSLMPAPAPSVTPPPMTPAPGTYAPMPMPTPTPMPYGMAPYGMTPPAGATPFGAPPPKDERRPFALWLVLLGAVAVLLALWLVVWPRLSGEDVAEPSVGVVVVSGGAAPSTGVVPPSAVPSGGADVAPSTDVPSTTTALPAVDPAQPPPSHRPHRRDGRAADTTPEATTTTAPAPPASSAPATGDGYLSLITSPWTHVTEGAHDLGETPLVRVPLAPGHHTLRLVNTEAGISETYDVDIEAGQTTSRRLGLR